jgi:hypothetical protein
MNKKQSSAFVWGIAGNIVASFLIALANILIGRFIPNAPREVLDVSSIILPLLFIILFLYRDKIRKVRIKPRFCLSQIRKLITQMPQWEEIAENFRRIFNNFRQIGLRFFEISHQTVKLADYFEKAKIPSAILITLVTVVIVVGFGVSIRWLFEQRTITTIPPITSSYHLIYEILAP